jgi:hypothetical protein
MTTHQSQSSGVAVFVVDTWMREDAASMLVEGFVEGEIIS